MTFTWRIILTWLPQDPSNWNLQQKIHTDSNILWHSHWSQLFAVDESTTFVLAIDTHLGRWRLIISRDDSLDLWWRHSISTEWKCTNNFHREESFPNSLKRLFTIHRVSVNTITYGSYQWKWISILTVNRGGKLICLFPEIFSPWIIVSEFVLFPVFTLTASHLYWSLCS